MMEQWKLVVPFLLNEDLNSDLNQARRIFMNNGASEDHAEVYLKTLQEIMRDVRYRDPKNRKGNVSSNLPGLAFWLLAFVAEVDDMVVDYQNYVNTESLWSRNYLGFKTGELMKELKDRKLFKPSEEKMSVIRKHMRELVETIHEKFQPEDSGATVKAGVANADTVYEDQTIIVYLADSKNKCIKYGAGSNLCIAVKGAGNYYWSYRMGDMGNGMGMTTYFVYWKGNLKKRILVDVLGDEDGPSGTYSWNPINPNTDREITSEKLIEKYPELKTPFQQGVFQFIPYGDKERKYRDISRIRRIDDEKLQTLEDYEMFAETRENHNVPSLLDLEHVEEMRGFSKQQMAFLVKKMAGTGAMMDPRILKKYLSGPDLDWSAEQIMEECLDDEDAITIDVYPIIMASSLYDPDIYRLFDETFFSKKLNNELSYEEKMERLKAFYLSDRPYTLMELEEIFREEPKFFIGMIVSTMEDFSPENLKKEIPEELLADETTFKFLTNFIYANLSSPMREEKQNLAHLFAQILFDVVIEKHDKNLSYSFLIHMPLRFFKEHPELMSKLILFCKSRQNEPDITNKTHDYLLAIKIFTYCLASLIKYQEKDNTWLPHMVDLINEYLVSDPLFNKLFLKEMYIRLTGYIEHLEEKLFEIFSMFSDKMFLKLPKDFIATELLSVIYGSDSQEFWNILKKRSKIAIKNKFKNKKKTKNESVLQYHLVNPKLYKKMIYC